MRTITLEEHFVTQDFLKATGAYGSAAPSPMQHLLPQLLDVGEGRIRAMDQSGIDLQVLSLAAMSADKLSPASQTALASSVHDELAAAVAAHPERFKAFCTPALKEPAKAVGEIDRALRLPGFVGVMLNGITDGRFLDAPELFPVLEAIAAHGVPLYISSSASPGPR